MHQKKSVMMTCIIILGVLATACSASTVVPSSPTAAPSTAASPQPPAPTPTDQPTGKSPKYGGILTVSTIADPVSLDILQETAHTTQNVVQCAYNGVIQFDPSDPEEAIRDLARSWEISPEGQSYTFHLQKDVKFHDGNSFSSEDVRFSFERQIDPPKGVLAPRRADLAAISKVEAPDRDTVKFILKYPSPSFLSVMSSGWMAVYSKAFVEKKGSMKNDVMGTGPYKLKAYSFGGSVEYVKNPDYFIKGRPYIDDITFYIIKDAATRLAAFRTGRVKLTGPGESGLTPSDVDTLARTMPQAVIMSYPALSRANLAFNTLQAPWTDVRVRRAADIAIDRQKAIEVLGNGYGEVGSNMPGKWGIPKEDLLRMPGYRQPKDADLEEAKRLLAEAGYPNGFTVKTLVVAQRRFQDLSVFMADQLSKIGIKLELDIREMAVRTQMLNQGAFNNSAMTSSLAFPDPENVARYWSRPRGDNWGQNQQRYSDEKIWELLEKQSRALDPAERLKIVRELDLKLMESSARPGVFWSHDRIGMWPDVKDRGKVIGMYSFQKYQDIWLAN